MGQARASARGRRGGGGGRRRGDRGQQAGPGAVRRSRPGRRGTPGRPRSAPSSPAPSLELQGPGREREPVRPRAPRHERRRRERLLPADGERGVRRLRRRARAPRSPGRSSCRRCSTPARRSSAPPTTMATRSCVRRVREPVRDQPVRTELQQGEVRGVRRGLGDGRPDGFVERVPVRLPQGEPAERLPKVGVWPAANNNAYFASFNQFRCSTSNSDFAWRGAGRSRTTGPRSSPATRRTNYFDLSGRSEPGGQLPADADGTMPPGAGRPTTSSRWTPTSSAIPTTRSRSRSSTSTGHAGPTPTFAAQTTSLTTANFSPWVCGAGKTYCIPQKGTTNKLDARATRVWRLQYRNMAVATSGWS